MRPFIVLCGLVILGCSHVAEETDDRPYSPAVDRRVDTAGQRSFTQRDEATLRESRLLRETEAERNVSALADRLALPAADNATLRAILLEHAQARLEIEDYLLRNRGIPGAERKAILLDGRAVPPASLEKARPAFVMSRMRRELGEAVLARYVAVTQKEDEGNL